MNGKTILSGIFILAVSLNITGCANITSAFLTSNTFIADAILQDEQDYPVRKEIRQTFQLSPNGVVDVSGIEGSVEVETTDGNTVEISFVREARTQIDFDCESISVQQSADKIVIRHHTKKEKQCSVIQAREHLKLSVPRSVNLTFKDIEGGFTVGSTEGFLQLNNIEGVVKIEMAQAAEIGSVESNLSLNVGEVNARGININNIEGAVELGVKKNLNADLKIDSSNVQIDIPNSQSSAFGRKNYQLQLGAGGKSISISNIEGGVKIRGM
jgi:hypothetical protein